MAQPCPCHGDSRVWTVEEEIFGGLGLQDQPGPTAVPHVWTHTPPALGLRLLGGKTSFHGAAVGLCGVVELSLELGGALWGCFLGCPRGSGQGTMQGGAQPCIPGTPHTKPSADPALAGLQPRGGGKELWGRGQWAAPHPHPA